MNFIEHLTKPKIAIYCLDIVPFDIETFQKQLFFVTQTLFLFLNLMNNNLLA